MSGSTRLCLAVFFLFVVADATGADDRAKLRFRVHEQGELVPCRIHLSDSAGKPIRAPALPNWRDHFVCPGSTELTLSPGRYSFTVERGPEYSSETAVVELRKKQERTLNITLRRLTNLRDKGWYSGDLHVHRPVSDIELLMRAEDLDFAPVITWWNKRNPWANAPIPPQLERKFDGHRLYRVLAGEDEREGGALLYFGLSKPIDITKSDREHPSPLTYLDRARKQNPNVWIDIEKPFWWDVPTWLATGKMNSIGLANNHMCRSQMYESEAWGKPRDKERLPAPRGNGYWTQEIYYHILNAGLRLPPSAGSASGVLPNPVGYNRVYVHLDKPFTSKAWFDALAAGRCFVTNGPLLLVKADGQHPGSILRVKQGERREVELKIALVSGDRVKHLEVIHNGVIVKAIPCADKLTQTLTTTIRIDETGWLLVRAIADVKKTFRFGSTAPWYVEIPTTKHRISKRSVRFFQAWIDQRIERVKTNVKDEGKRAAVLRRHEQAREFWKKRLADANAE